MPARWWAATSGASAAEFRSVQDSAAVLYDAPSRQATPLFVVLLLVEFSDLIFAVDSIPAIFAVTKDPFIVYTSNVFAILGLRALYFMLAGAIHKNAVVPDGLTLADVDGRALPVAIVTVILSPGWAWTTADEARVRSAPLRRMDSGSSSSGLSCSAG